MQVGILGSGDVGKTLACGFIKHGHRVMLGTRTGDKLAEWAAQNPSARTGGFAETATFGEIVVLAVKGTVALDALQLAGAAVLAGKTVIDAANPIADTPPVNGVLSFFTDQNESLMERLQGAFLETRFVKAFNSVGAGLMINPRGHSAIARGPC